MGRGLGRFLRGSSAPDSSAWAWSSSHPHDDQRARAAAGDDVFPGSGKGEVRSEKEKLEYSRRAKVIDQAAQQPLTLVAVIKGGSNRFN